MGCMDIFGYTWGRQVFITGNFATADKLRILLERRGREMDIGRQPAIFHSLTQQANRARNKAQRV